MIETLQNLKQTINERIKNPFIGAFFISWVIINWRPIFIILFSHDEIYNKIGVIDKNYSDWHNYFLWPILIAIFYIIILPYLMALFEFLVSFSQKFRDGNYANIKILELKNQNKILIQQVENEKAINDFKDSESINLKIENLNSVIKAKDTLFENSKQNYESIIDEYKRELESSAENIKEIEKNYNRRLLDYRNAKIQQEQTENDLRELLNILDRVPFTVNIIENNDVFKLIKEKYKK